MREGMQITQVILQLRAAMNDPAHAARLKPEQIAEAKMNIQALMDVLESNRRMLPRGAAGTQRFTVRLVELLAAFERAAP